MLKIFLVTIALMGSASAQELSGQVTNFNFEYTSPMGEGEVDSFSFNGQTFESAHVSVEKVVDKFKLVLTGSQTGEFLVGDLPSFVQDADAMSVTGLNVNLGQTASVDLGDGQFDSKDDSLSISGLHLNCNRNQSEKEAMDQLLKGCTESMSFKVSKFVSDSRSSVAVVLANAISKASRGSVKIKDLDFKSNAGKYTLSANVDAALSGKAKSNGNLSYDSSTGVLTVKISEVKFGILTVTGQVFSELKKNQTDKLKVKEPYVYITVK